MSERSSQNTAYRARRFDSFTAALYLHKTRSVDKVARIMGYSSEEFCRLYSLNLRETPQQVLERTCKRTPGNSTGLSRVEKMGGSEKGAVKQAPGSNVKDSWNHSH